MKVFRISGRDTSPAHGCATPSGAASMKVFRISGRDQVLNNRIRGVSCGLNESLPHKRKRQLAESRVLDHALGLNESLPHKRKRRECPA